MSLWFIKQLSTTTAWQLTKPVLKNLSWSLVVHKGFMDGGVRCSGSTHRQASISRAALQPHQRLQVDSSTLPQQFHLHCEFTGVIQWDPESYVPCLVLLWEPHLDTIITHWLQHRKHNPPQVTDMLCYTEFEECSYFQHVGNLAYPEIHFLN